MCIRDSAWGKRAFFVPKSRCKYIPIDLPDIYETVRRPRIGDLVYYYYTEYTGKVNYKEFKKYDTEILGVSRDSVKSHENFKSKQSFPFELLSDPDEKMCNAFDVMKMKSMYGKQYLGVDRSTFLIDKAGKVKREWRSVKVKGHVDEVLNEVKNL